MMNRTSLSSATELLPLIRDELKYIAPEMQYMTRFSDRERSLWRGIARTLDGVEFNAKAHLMPHLVSLRSMLIKWLENAFRDPSSDFNENQKSIATAGALLDGLDHCLTLQDDSSIRLADHAKFIRGVTFDRHAKDTKTLESQATEMSAIDRMAYGPQGFTPDKIMREIRSEGQYRFGRMLLKETSTTMVGYYIGEFNDACMRVTHAALKPSFVESGAREALAKDILSECMLRCPPIAFEITEDRY